MATAWRNMMPASQSVPASQRNTTAASTVGKLPTAAGSGTHASMGASPTGIVAGTAGIGKAGSTGMRNRGMTHATNGSNSR